MNAQKADLIIAGGDLIHLTDDALKFHGVVNNREVVQRFEGRNLMRVLQGHLPVNEWHRWRGATFVTGGAVCGKWWRGPWQGTEEGFGTLTLHPDRVDWSYIDYGWTARRP